LKLRRQIKKEGKKKDKSFFFFFIFLRKEKRKKKKKKEKPPIYLQTHQKFMRFVQGFLRAEREQQLHESLKTQYKMTELQKNVRVC